VPGSPRHELHCMMLNQNKTASYSSHMSNKKSVITVMRRESRYLILPGLAVAANPSILAGESYHGQMIGHSEDSMERTVSLKPASLG
jgi:hypothetical protein